MKQVRCVSRWGGCHNGMTTRGDPVLPVWDASKGEHVLPDLKAEELRLPPNPGGYVADGRIAGGYAAVGQVYDVPDDFAADGDHYEDVAPPATAPKPAPQPAPASEGA